jgi:hypothetical protein
MNQFMPPPAKPLVEEPMAAGRRQNSMIGIVENLNDALMERWTPPIGHPSCHYSIIPSPHSSFSPPLMTPLVEEPIGMGGG